MNDKRLITTAIVQGMLGNPETTANIYQLVDSAVSIAEEIMNKTLISLEECDTLEEYMGLNELTYVPENVVSYYE